MGHSIKRKEDPRFVRGQGTYVDDIRLQLSSILKKLSSREHPFYAPIRKTKKTIISFIGKSATNRPLKKPSLQLRLRSGRISTFQGFTSRPLKHRAASRSSTR